MRRCDLDCVVSPRLECDQECAALERNRRLAEALQIDVSVDPFNVRSTSKYSDSLRDDARYHNMESDCSSMLRHSLTYSRCL